VLIPEENRKDLAEIPANIREGLGDRAGRAMSTRCWRVRSAAPTEAIEWTEAGRTGGRPVRAAGWSSGWPHDRPLTRGDSAVQHVQLHALFRPGSIWFILIGSQALSAALVKSCAIPGDKLPISGAFGFDSRLFLGSLPDQPRFRFGHAGCQSEHANGGSAMNKNDLISAVADASGLSKGDATKAVEAVFDSVTGALAKGDEVRLVGFGTFFGCQAQGVYRPQPAHG